MTPEKKWPVSKSCFIGIVAAQSVFSQSWNRWNYPKQPSQENIRQLSASAIPYDDLEHEDEPHDDRDQHQDRLRQDYGREGFYAFTEAIDYTQYKVWSSFLIDYTQYKVWLYPVQGLIIIYYWLYPV